MKKRTLALVLAMFMALTAIAVVPSSAEITPGDANGDGKINGRDVIIMMDAVIAGYSWDELPSPLVFEALDINGDGKINARDVMEAMRLCLKNARFVFPGSSSGKITLSASDVTVAPCATTAELVINVGNIPTDLGLAAACVAVSVDGGAEVANIAKLVDSGSGAFISGAFLWVDADKGVFTATADLAKVTINLPADVKVGDTFTVTLKPSDDDDNYMTFKADPTVGDTLGLGAVGSSFTITVGTAGHNYVPHVFSPTCYEGGYTKYTCSGCGDSYTADETPALGGHDYRATVTPPTCTENGYTTYTCSRCCDSYESDKTQALGHDFCEWYVMREASCTADGLAVRVCFRDNTHVEYSAIRHLGHSFVNGVCTRCGEEGVLAGDLNGDGKLNNRDVVAIMRLMLKANPEITPACDLNGDGKLNNRDVVALMRLLLTQS